MESKYYFESITAVTNILKYFLQDRITTGINDVSVSMISRPLDEIPQQTNGANIFLYNITPDTVFNNSQLPTRNSDGYIQKNSLQFGINLHYIFSAYCMSQNDLLDQRVLGIVLLVLQEYSIMTNKFLKDIVASGLANDPENFSNLVSSGAIDKIDRIKISLNQDSTEIVPKIWGMFSNSPYRTSLLFTVNIVLLEQEIPKPPPIPVLERQIHINTRIGIPQITEIEPRYLEFENIDQKIVIKGKNFSSQNEIRISFDLLSKPLEDLAIPTLVTPERLEVLIPPEDMTIGTKIVQLISVLSMGNPPSLRSLARSNRVIFEIVPKITNISNTNISPGQAVEIELEPAISAEDKINLLIGSFPPIETVTVDTNRVRVPSFPGPTEIPPGLYPVRVEHKGMPSILHIEKNVASPNFNTIQPSIEVLP